MKTFYAKIRIFGKILNLCNLRSSDGFVIKLKTLVILKLNLTTKLLKCS